MKRWTILLIVLILAGCASQPIELPNWELAEREKIPATAPLPLPDLCSIPSSGEWPIECWKALDAYDIAANANYEIAQANANALSASDDAYDSLLTAARTQAEVARIRQEMLDRERQAHTLDNWWHRTIIVLIAIGVAL